MNWRLLLLPFSWLFGTVTFLRRWLYEKGVLSSEKSSVATICVGNLKVGGTGKTPHIEYLIRLLRKDFSVAVLSRGYGRESKGYLLVNDLPDNQLNALQIGDEPMQLFQKFPDVKIALSEKRALGVRSLRKQFPDLDVILLDDGFQHLSFSPSLKMILTEFADPYFKDYPLPAGNLREFPFASKSADAVIVTKCPTSIDENDREHYKRKLKITPKQHAFFSSIIYKYSIEDKLRGNIMNLDQDTSVFLLTGIANPKPLLREVAK
ncbi:tetraacyldisaccharide 4'-kinase, partial [Bacteroidales bacterium OttesenSCG-928-L19]|nr:tetraacyldisaccharide 4'-kinase [Bacteroidales bacterium OttesenSCG-928-L19]